MEARLVWISIILLRDALLVTVVLSRIESECSMIQRLILSTLGFGIWNMLLRMPIQLGFFLFVFHLILMLDGAPSSIAEGVLLIVV